MILLFFQSAMTSGLIVGAFLIWLAAGASSVNKRRQEILPTLTHGCHLATNQSDILTYYKYGQNINRTVFDASNIHFTTQSYDNQSLIRDTNVTQSM